MLNYKVTLGDICTQKIQGLRHTQEDMVMRRQFGWINIFLSGLLSMSTK